MNEPTKHETALVSSTQPHPRLRLIVRYLSHLPFIKLLLSHLSFTQHTNPTLFFFTLINSSFAIMIRWLVGLELNLHEFELLPSPKENFNFCLFSESKKKRVESSFFKTFFRIFSFESFFSSVCCLCFILRDAGS
jgi:hypothetical protein